MSENQATHTPETSSADNPPTPAGPETTPPDHPEGSAPAVAAESVTQQPTHPVNAEPVTRVQGPFPPPPPYGVPPQGMPPMYGPVPPPGAPQVPGPAQTYGAVPPVPPPYGAPPPGTPPYRPYGAPAPAAGGRRSGGFGRTLGIVTLAVASGLFGGFVATQLDSDQGAPGTSPITSGDGRPAPDLKRSSLAEVVAKVQPSVVSVKTGSGEGSGVVLNRDGLVLTNNHVVAGAQGDQVTIVFSDGKSRDGSVMGADPRSDLAVVKTEDASQLTPAVFGDSDKVNVGDTVLALGSPLGLEGSVSSGIISAKDRTIRSGDGGPTGAASIAGMLQTDTAINPGNSGGPLVNLAGEVIGINTAIATAGNGTGNIGVGFAIPSNTAKRVAEQLVAGEKVSHPYLGVGLADVEGGGALVQNLAPGGPADQGGIREGDVVVKFADRAINNADDLVSAVQSAKVGDKVPVTYTRDGSERQTTVTLAEAPTR